VTSSDPNDRSDPAAALVPLLPTLSRLALAYAPARARLPTLALFALDSRLAGLLRHSREPMLAQLRLSWWREMLAQDVAAWPTGDPLLAALRSWDGAHSALVPLVDGWEALTGATPLPAASLSAMADGRAAGFAALARVLGRDGEAGRVHTLGRRWALADLATRLSHPGEQAEVRVLLAQEFESGRRVSRALRPLAVLEGLARRQASGGGEASVGTLAVAMRLGLFGI